MLKATLAGLRAHLLRLLMTALSISLGVAFVSGTFALTDTLTAGFDQQFTASAGKVSVAVLPNRADAPITAAALARIRALPGVKDAQGQVRASAPLLGRDGRVYGDVSTLGISIASGSLQRYEVRKGRAPAGPGEAVLGDDVARRAGFHVGDRVHVLDAKGADHAFTVTGLMNFGVDQEINVRGAVGFTAPVAAAMTGRRDFVEIDVKGAPGTGDARLRDAVATATGPSVTVVTSDQLAKRMTSGSGADPKQITVFFLSFALVALFVAALVIYNTFTILITQRMREMALLRCVGATRAQVFRSVLTESAVVGLFASAFGALAGVGLGWAATAFFGSGTGMPAGSLVVSATPFLVGVPTGLAVTVLSALLPARAATRVSPVAALRRPAEGSVEGRAGKVRIAVGAVLTAGGLFACAAALSVTPGMGPFLLVLAGGALTFLGVVALSPLIVRGLAGIIGGPVARLFGVPGRLARENSRRNPRRAAVTTIALTVGVTLMTMFSVALSSAQDTTDAMLAKHFPVDYQLATQDEGGLLVPHAVATRLRADGRFSSVIELRGVTAAVNGVRHDVGAFDRTAIGHVLDPEVKAGSLRDFGPGSVLLLNDTARSLGVRPGQSITVRTTTGSAPLRVAAVVADNGPMPGVTLDQGDFGRLYGAMDDKAVYLVARKGVSTDASRAAVEAATKAYPTVRIQSLADARKGFTDALDSMFLVVAALLALAVVISLIGLANTLTLSVVERTRESALLRALGLPKRGLRRMLSLEAVIIAVIAAVIGVGLGAGLGWTAISAAVPNVVLGYPVGRVVLFVLLAAVAGVLAAVLPARRAAKASIVESLAAE